MPMLPYDALMEIVRRIVLDRIARGDDDFTRNEWTRIAAAAEAANLQPRWMIRQACEAIARGLTSI